MNGEFDYVHEEINGYVVLLRSEQGVVKKQELLDKINNRNRDLKRIHDELRRIYEELKQRLCDSHK